MNADVLVENSIKFCHTTVKWEYVHVRVGSETLKSPADINMIYDFFSLLPLKHCLRSEYVKLNGVD